MWCLARLLPLMIGHRVPEGDRHWSNFLLLLTIMDYLLAPVVLHDVTSFLRVLIDDHHTEFVALYSQCSVTPKFHYMVHYPKWIDWYIMQCEYSLLKRHKLCRCGPLVRFWCMRYEAKHNYFKTLAQQIKCFKNIPKSLANHHQRLMCLYFNSKSGMDLNKQTISGTGTI